MLGSSYSIGPVVKNLLIINGLMLLLKMVLGTDAGGHSVLDRELGLFALNSPNFRPWQLVTHMFMHGDFWHLFSNMLGLFMFGSMIEQVWGSKRFLTYYMICGLGAAALQLGINAWEIQGHVAELASYGISLSDIRPLAALPLDESYINEQLTVIGERTNAPSGAVITLIKDLAFPMVGASGAIFGVLLAFGMLFPNVEIMLLFLPIPIKAKYFVVLYGLWELSAGVRATPGDNIAHYAHLGGMIFGLLLILYWRRQRAI